MSDASLLTLMKFALIGGGLMTIGVLNLLMSRSTSLTRLLINSGLLVVFIGILVQQQFAFDFILTVGGTLALGIGGSSLLGSSHFRHWIDRMLNFSQTNLARYGSLALIGIVVTSYGVYKFEHDDEAKIDFDQSMFEKIAWRPPLHVDNEQQAWTDAGNLIELNAADQARSGSEISELEEEVLNTLQFNFSIIRHQAPDETSNCHGWVFTGGKYWLGPEMVSKILDENGYQPVLVPQVGDVVIYRNSVGILHTAIVRYVNGDVPIVEGKWGWMGVFLHPVDHSCYGTDFTYYRSPREGHLVVGLGGKPAAKTRTLPPVTDMERLPRHH